MDGCTRQHQPDQGIEHCQCDSTGGLARLSHLSRIGRYVQQCFIISFYTDMIPIDKVLMAYPLDTLDPTSTTTSSPKARQKLPSYRLDKSVSFFQAGVCDRRVLVVVKKKKGVDSVFTALEPVCGDLRDSRNAKYLSTKTGLLSRAPSWFKTYRVSTTWILLSQ